MKVLETEYSIEANKRLLSQAFIYIGDFQRAEEAVQEFYRKMEENPKIKISYHAFQYHLISLHSRRKKIFRVTKTFSELGKTDEKSNSSDFLSSRLYLDTPEFIVMRDEKNRMVRDSLLELPGMDREALIMRYFSGMGYKDMMGELHLSKGGVGERLKRAKNRLKDILLRKGIDHD